MAFEYLKIALKVFYDCITFLFYHSILFHDLCDSLFFDIF